ncbi:MAG: SMP-30/gluconolactonase/LRE family protein [Prevotellaceae bacterium]|nr:SMP-30/gluconolactonase/LRE family protein [Prevotellaceae bacterium]MDY6098790.1 SMP-30/gluconolactonase/LRE family protein [Bacteroidaceae bacterium]
MHIHSRFCVTLSVACGLLAACSDSEGSVPEEDFTHEGRGVYILNEGNYNSGNSTLSYYDPEKQTIENGIFQRANDRKLGDTGQSMTLFGNTLFIAMENSGIVWAIDPRTSRVKGSLTTGQTEQMINPRYVHIVNSGKAYITDLYAPYITIFNPTTFTYTGSIPTGQAITYGYSSTEKMVEWKNRVFTNCWSYNNKILVIDTRTDEVTDSILLDSWQPKDMQIDARGKLWVITDGGYNTEHEGFGDNIPHLYRIDAETLAIEQDQPLDADNASVAMALSNDGHTLYLINNDIYRMDVTDSHLPVRPFIKAPTDANGTRHKLYGISVDPSSGDLYVADAVDYSQAGTMYRYKADGTLIHKFRVGINPNGCAFIP